MVSGWYLPTAQLWDIPPEGRAPKSPITIRLTYVMLLRAVKSVIKIQKYANFI